MDVLSFQPNDTLLRLQQILDRFVNPAFGFDTYGAAEPGVFPHLNIFTDGDGVVVRAEVPGVSSGDLEVVVEDGRLLIAGERKAGGPANGKHGSYHRRERPVGKFSRALRLPDDLDTAEAKAACRNGVLTVRIPRREAAKPRKVTIE
jgi:HSP20 family protein